MFPKRKCRYRQAQTRSADEPMTTFVTYVCIARPTELLTDCHADVSTVETGQCPVSLSLFSGPTVIQVEVFLIGPPSCILPHFYRLRISFVPMPMPEFNCVYPSSHFAWGIT